jgi:DNA-binding helix-hairpin-helix protein with protein kinase domain
MAIVSTVTKIFHSPWMVHAQQLVEDLAKISSYSNVVTSVWHVQMGSKVSQKLSNGYSFLLYKNFL